jgi:hypothetical protein
MLAATPPAVGIFWRLNDVLVIDRSTLDEAEPYGDCLGHAAGHYERWQEWQALGAARRTTLGYPDFIASTEYDQWPRGRIVYETLARRFVRMLTGACKSLPSLTPSSWPSVWTRPKSSSEATHIIDERAAAGLAQAAQSPIPEGKVGRFVHLPILRNSYFWRRDQDNQNRAGNGGSPP